MPVTFDELGRKLHEERERLCRGLEQLRASGPAMGEAREGSPYGKKEEGASEAFELEKRVALEGRLSGLLDEVEHALKKIEQGTYGFCDVCGKPIAPERLEVLPQAALCLDCKSQAKNAKGRFLPR